MVGVGLDGLISVGVNVTVSVSAGSGLPCGGKLGTRLKPPGVPAPLVTSVGVRPAGTNGVGEGSGKIWLTVGGMGVGGMGLGGIKVGVGGRVGTAIVTCGTVDCNSGVGGSDVGDA